MSHCASACQTQLPVFILVIPVGQTVRTPSESNFGLGRTGKNKQTELLQVCNDIL